MKIINKLFFLMFFFSKVSLTNTESSPLDIVILLDDGQDYNNFPKNIPIYLSLITVILKSPVPILAPSNLFVLLTQTGDAEDTFKIIQAEWILYKAHEFILALPKKYWKSIDVSNKENLHTIGLNKEKLTILSLPEFKSLLAERKNLFEARRKNSETIEPITLNNLKDIFANPQARKRIILEGHGTYGDIEKKENPFVAGISINDFKKLLALFNVIGTDLVYVNSCYAGGINLLQAFQDNAEKSLKNIFPNYFLIIGSVTDESVIQNELYDFRNFFYLVNQFLTAPKGLPTNIFKTLLAPLQPGNLPQNIPSIRFPGSVNYFKAVDLNNKTEIITYANATAHALDFKAGNITSWPIKAKDIVLLYPIKITVPLILEKTLPRFISMIPGNSFHLFNEIQAPGTLNTVIEKLFLNPELAAEKMFLIGRLTTLPSDDIGFTQANYENVVIHTKSFTTGGVIWLRAQNEFYKAVIEYDKKTQQLKKPLYKEIRGFQAFKQIYKALANINVLPQAVKQASGGQEDLEQMRQLAMKSFTITQKPNLLITTLSNPSPVNAVAFSPDGAKLAAALSDNTIKIWDMKKNKELITLSGHSNLVSSVAFSPDDKKLATGSWDGTVKIWDTTTYKLIATLSGHANPVTSVAISPDSKTLASGSMGIIKLWDMGTYKEINTLRGHTGNVLTLIFNPVAPKLLTSGASDNTIKTWDLTTNTVISKLSDFSMPVSSVAYNRDSSKFANGSWDKTVEVVNFLTNKGAKLLGHTDKVTSIAFSPHENRLASASADKTIKIWDLQTNKEIATLTGHSATVTSLAFSPDGTKLASGSLDKTIKVWNITLL